MSPRFLPTASLETLKLRSRLVASLRDFFQANGYWECETPILSREVIIDANLDPFVTHDLNGDLYYMQTSPEAGMKRLLSAGANAIFQITRAMRRGESGQLHNLEFTMVEWYRTGDDHHDQMNFVEQLVRAFYEEAGRHSQGDSNAGSLRLLPSSSFERLTYDEAFERYVGTRVLHLSPGELREFVAGHQIVYPSTLNPDDRDGLLNLLLAELVEPNLGQTSPQFIYDYPGSQAALAKIRKGSLKGKAFSLDENGLPSVAERFELYDRGVELCNGYHELTDADEFSTRTLVEQKKAELAGHRKLPDALMLEEALHQGLPDCAGVALGLDRLVMMALGKDEIRDVIAFPRERA